MTQFNNYKPVRLIELFAGIGSQAKALKNLGVDFEHWYVCDFDKYAIKSYNAVHGTDYSTSDITKITANDLNIVDTDSFTYLLTYSFPCQDLSNAGKGKGMAKGSGTRSGLLWEVERLLNECTELPQVLLMENVTQVHGTKNKEHFEKWIEFLSSKGYSNYWKDMNAKNYGVPQSRNRCFMVSILGDYSFEFPQEIPLTLTLKDVLDDVVDERYYLSDTQISSMKSTNFSSAKYENRVNNPDGIASTLLARDYKDPKCVICDEPIRLGGLYDTDEQRRQAGSIWDENGLSPTLGTMQGGNSQPLIIDGSNTSELKRTYCNTLLEKGLVGEGDVVRHSYTNNRLSNGIDNMSRTENKEKICPTLDTRCDCLGVVVKQPSELQKDVCNKIVEQNLMQPFDIIDYTYSNSRLSEIENGAVKTKNSTNNQISNTITCNVENMGDCVPQVISEQKKEKCSNWISERGVKYICDPKRGMCTDINAEVAQTVTASGQRNWTGSFISPDIDHLEKSSTIGSTEPTIIHLKNGDKVTSNDDLSNLRIRKFTPKECWRLMGFDDEDFSKAEKVCSNSQLYKQAGNSIVVNVLMAIFKELLIPKKTRSQWLTELLGG